MPAAAYPSDSARKPAGEAPQDPYAEAPAAQPAQAAPPAQAEAPQDPYAEATPAPEKKAPAKKAPKARPPKKGKGAKAPAAPEAPLDPYGADPAPPPTPPPSRSPSPPPSRSPSPSPPPPPPPSGDAPQDPYAADTAARDLDEAIAASLVVRARVLLDQRAYADARQLAVESLLRSANGPSSAEARELLATANRQLGLPDTAAPPETAPSPETAPAAPQGDRTLAPTFPASDPRAPRRADRSITGQGVMVAYGVAAGAVAGVGLTGLASDDDPLAISLGVVGGGALGGLGGLALARRYRPTVAEARTVGSGATWGATAIGLMADVVELDGTGAGEVGLGASLGVLGGGLLGAAVARRQTPSTGDVTLVDSLASWGLVGGLTLGVGMQPPESEAYTLNAALGVAGGVGIGTIAARRTEMSVGRLVRVNLWAYGGAAAPWLLYGLTSDGTTDDDEQAFGFLSTAGLIAGAWIGFATTRGFDQRRDRAASDAPVALLRRGSDGAWDVGALTLRPAASGLGPALGRSAVVDVVGARF